MVSTTTPMGTSMVYALSAWLRFAPAKSGRRATTSAYRSMKFSGQTVSGTLSDTRAGTVAVWVGTPGDFESLELLADAS